MAQLPIILYLVQVESFNLSLPFSKGIGTVCFKNILNSAQVLVKCELGFKTVFL